MMTDMYINLLGVRVFISCIGCIGNLILIFDISHRHVKISAVKSFELFVLGLALSNLEEILIVNVYDIILLADSTTISGTWSCSLLKFLTLFGELSSILFTVVICIFRYQKVHDVTERLNLPTYLDHIMSALFVSGVCVLLSLSLSAPIFFINVQRSAENSTRTNCPPDFFQCNDLHCPNIYHIYKYVFIVLCHILPMVIVTITSCLIIAVLLSQDKKVEPEVDVSGTGHFGNKSHHANHHRSTIAVLAAMGLFQVNWSVHLFVQLSFDSSNFAFWNEMKFFVSTSYTSISPYVFGIGNNVFSIKHFTRK